VGTDRPVVASYCATFLKPEMLHIYRQITGLQRYRAAVFAQKRENADRFPFADVTTVPRGKGRWLRRFWRRQVLRAPVLLSGDETRRLRAAIDRARPAVLHVYFGHIAVQLLPLLADWQPLPAVVSFHGADVLVELDRPAYRRATMEMLGRVHLALARSQSLIDALIQLGCPPEKLRLHRTGIPLGEFGYQRRVPPADGRWRLFQACRLIEKKGLPTSLRAFQQFARVWPQARFTIAGDGPLEPALRALCGELGIGEQVEFAGFLTQEELRRKLYEAHMFLHPSEMGADGNQEGVPNSLLEAMASGLPSFGSTHGGIPEAIEHGVSGWLISEGEHAALGQAMCDLAADPERLAAMGAAASKAVAEKFEHAAQAARLESYYDEAIALARAKPA
jgi:colanic acid/amylovoran biosynthesis glycosyltransferase